MSEVGLDRDKDLKLIYRVQHIFAKSDFLTDRNVNIEAEAGAKTELDVCAWYKEVLVITYCTSGQNLKFQNLVDKWSKWREDILNQKRSISIKSSEDSNFTSTILENITVVKMVIAVDNYEPKQEMAKYAADRGISVLNKRVLDYYEHTVKALGKWMKYGFFRDLEIVREEESGTISRPAIMVRQPGINKGKEMYIFTLAAHELLPIAYVFRRSFKPELAYQRLVKQRRIETIGRFLNGQVLIPNAILVAFDDEIASTVVFTQTAHNSSDGVLSIPKKYCSAWIVDGQHRLYGFTRTKFCEPPPESPIQQEKFELIIVGLKNLDRTDQARSFIDINDNQKGIDPTLLCDLATLTHDLRYFLTWPSLLVKELNSDETGPWLNRIKTLEIEKDRPISLAGFAKFALADELLKRQENKSTNQITYTGPLYVYAKFDLNSPANDSSNLAVLSKQTRLLTRYFSLVKEHLEAKRPGSWNDETKYGVTKTVAVNALLLVLNQILRSKKRNLILQNFQKFLRPISSLSFTNAMIAKYGTGWQAFRGLANRIIDVLNSGNSIKLDHTYD